jgi:hypothetical protein
VVVEKVEGTQYEYQCHMHRMRACDNDVPPLPTVAADSQRRDKSPCETFPCDGIAARWHELFCDIADLPGVMMHCDSRLNPIWQLRCLAP